jgi:8-oxo-dGTP pyrophosphatase MutT (NUDIX family)
MCTKLQFAQKAIIIHDNQLLLIQKSSNDPYQPFKWEVPGGRLHSTEELDDGLVREVREEVGIEIIPGPPLSMWSWYLGDGPDSVRVIAVSRKCEAVGRDIDSSAQEDSDHIGSWAWVPLDEVHTLDLISNARHAILESIERSQ